MLLPLALPASDPACGEGAIVFNKSLLLLVFTGCGKPSQGLKKNGNYYENLAFSGAITAHTLEQVSWSSRGP